MLFDLLVNTVFIELEFVLVEWSGSLLFIPGDNFYADICKIKTS